MNRADVGTLDATKTWRVPSVTAPAHDWPGAPGCRRGARFLIDFPNETDKPGQTIIWPHINVSTPTLVG